MADKSNASTPGRAQSDGDMSLSKRLDALLQDVESAEEADLLLTQMKKYINLHFSNEVGAPTEGPSSLNITTH
ncbi:hypothetical protein [Streptomyces sp. NPDC017520]|uniref:hypothetical protein n=1 Tax=Streptomyces sp. NPDC017520 TaxID=3364998 RepID=UPI0037BC7F89